MQDVKWETSQRLPDFLIDLVLYLSGLHLGDYLAMKQLRD
jgi:hypothetical protein